MLSGCRVRPVPPPEATEKYFLPFSYALLLVGTCNRVLESGRVGGVTSDGNVNAFLPHDCYALGNVVCAVAVNLSAQTGGVCLAEYFLNLAGVVIHLGLNICKAVDSGDDLCSVLAKTVQDNAERLLTNLVCLLCDTDSALSSRKGLVTCQEAEALCLFLEQHLCRGCRDQDQPYADQQQSQECRMPGGLRRLQRQRRQLWCSSS